MSDKFNNLNKKKSKNKFNNITNSPNQENSSNQENTSNKFNKNKRGRRNYYNNKNKRGRRYYNKNKKNNENNELVLNDKSNMTNYKDYIFYVDPNNLSTLYYYLPSSLKYDDNSTPNSESNLNSNSDANNNNKYYDEYYYRTNLLEDNKDKYTNTINNWEYSSDDHNFNYNKNPYIFSEDFEKKILEALKYEYSKDSEINKKSDDENDKEIIPKEYKWIKLPNINTLTDLIDIGKQWGTTWTDEFNYNINLKLLNDIVPELEDLNKMIGLGDVKSQIIDLIVYWALGLDNKNHDLLHTVIEGEPGTGKTELAEKLAKIYLKLGILKSNVFKKVKRADLVAGYLGQTAIKTAKIIEECKGGVLFIDEAYSLGNSEGKEGKDSFSKECIDTLNQALTESKSDFVCIIAGYADDLLKSFFSYNSGLERRFPIRFSIGTYTDEELGKIFIKKVKEYEWDINLNSKELGELIKLNRKYFKFNGGDMEILFAKCKISHSKNLLKSETKDKKILDKEDILDGINLYLLNPHIKNRGNDDNIKKYIHNTMYV